MAKESYKTTATRSVAEIIFTGKSVDEACWQEGSLLWDGVNAYIVNRHGDELHHKWLVNPDTVRQFTGWIDSEGTKIYDGDIIEKVDSFVVVSWGCDRDGNGPGWVCFFIDRFSKKRNLKRLLPMDKSIASGVVCGNVFDSQEILSFARPLH